MDTMDACNFPEFLALDLETAESIFAAKQMTAGLPRALGAIGTPEILSSDFLQLNANDTPCTRDAFPTAATATAAAGQDHGHAKLSDSDTDSIDSFVVANKTASLSSRRAEPQLNPDEHLGPVGKDVSDEARNTNSRISHRTRDSYASYEGYGSLFGDYDDADDGDNYTVPSDAESVSSFGVSVPTSNRDRQQSVVTSATSVSSCDRHPSVQSHILAAMGPFTPVCDPRHSGHSGHSRQSARSGTSLGRRVEFSLDTDATDARSSMEAPARASSEAQSWLDFDGDDSDDGRDGRDGKHRSSPFFQADPIRRPKTSAGRCSPGPRTGDLALRRRSSLDAGQLRAWMGTPSNLQQRRRLRHIEPLRELSVLSDAAPIGAPSVLSPQSRKSLSPMSPSVRSAGTKAEVPLVLQKTVYRPGASTSQPSSATENLRSYFDDADSDNDDDHCAGAEKMTRTRASTVTSRFDDFDDALATPATSEPARPFPRSAFGSIRSARSRLSVSSTAKPSFESQPFSCDSVLLNADKTSSELQHWLQHASEQQMQQDRQLLPPRPATSNSNRPVAHEKPLREEEEVDASSVVSQPFDYSSFYHPGVVGIPLPRDVVETLRVSVSCFPETMLSLSSFSVQTIRSYSRKVRRCRPSDADSTFRLLMDDSAQPGQKMETPSSPTTGSFRNGLSDSPDPTALRRTTTGVSVNSTASHRFWKFKRFGGIRPSSSSNSLGGGGNGSSARPPSSHIRTLREEGNNSELPSADDGQGKGNGICFKRIFPTGSDYLCDALYAHIIAFNYISLLCPPDAKPTPSGAASRVSSETDARPQTPGGNTIATTSTATLIENGDKTKRQTIRIYMDADVALDSLPVEAARATSPAAPRGDDDTAIMLDAELPPPSRGRPDDGNRLISRKAASLLGITELLEPDMSQNSIVLAKKQPSVGGGLARRYHTMRQRQRHQRTMTEEAAVAKKPTMATTSSKPKKPLEISKPLPVQSDRAPTTTLTTSVSTPAAFAPAELRQPPNLSPVAAAPPAAAAAAAASPPDTHLRDLQAGLHHCIIQLVATLKLTTGQLGSTTLLTAETTRQDLDPLFLRMLCELVRSQEEAV